MSIIDMSDHFPAAQAESADEEEAFLQRYRRTRAIDAAIERLFERLERKGYRVLEVADRMQGMANDFIELARDDWEKSAL